MCHLDATRHRRRGERACRRAGRATGVRIGHPAAGCRCEPPAGGTPRREILPRKTQVHRSSSSSSVPVNSLGRATTTLLTWRDSPGAQAVHQHLRTSKEGGHTNHMAKQTGARASTSEGSGLSLEWNSWKRWWPGCSPVLICSSSANSASTFEF